MANFFKSLMRFGSRAAGEKAATPGELFLNQLLPMAHTLFQQQQGEFGTLAGLRNQLLGGFQGGSLPPFASALLAGPGREDEATREAALEGGLRGGQLNQFLAEQPFRRRERVGGLMNQLLEGYNQNIAQSLQTGSQALGSAAGAGQAANAATFARTKLTTDRLFNLIAGLGKMSGQAMGAM